MPRLPMPSNSSLTAVLGLSVAAGLLGIAVSVVLVASGFMAGPLALVAWAVGAVTMGAIMPWRDLIQSSADRAAIRKLTRTVRAIDMTEHREPIADLQTKHRHEIGDLSRALYETLAQAAAVYLESNKLRRTMDHSIQKETTRATGRLIKEAATDPLTGLGNRRALSDRLMNFVHSSRRVSVLVVDLDRFKQVNDRLGHDAGDKCLLFFGRLLRSGLRGEDIAFRTGGDEFVILMPGQSNEIGETVAHRLEALFRQMPWPYDHVERPSLSIGVASAVPSKLSEPDELIRRADEAMYAAKRAGRGQVRNYNDLCSAA